MKNPFLSDVVYEASSYKPEWDVPSLNDDVVKELCRAIELVSRPDSSSDDRKFRVLLGQPGIGKTHLFGRIINRLEREVCCVFVGPIEDPLNSEVQIRRQVVKTLFHPMANMQETWIEWILARLCQESFCDYFDWLPGGLAARHEQMGKRLRSDPSAILEIVRQVSAKNHVRPFRILADSVVDSHGDLRGDVVRALAMGWSPEQDQMRRWLRGESMPEEELHRLGLGDDAPSLVDILKAVQTLAAGRIPIVVCFDNMENVLAHDDISNGNGQVSGTNRFTADLVRLQAELPHVLFVLSCLEDSWPDFMDRSYSMFQGA